MSDGIKSGCEVKLHYTLTVNDEVVESSRDGDPLSYTHGEGQIIPGLEEELEGMAPGDQRQVVVEPEKGYGQHDPRGVQKVPRDAFQDASGLSVGDVVTGQGEGQNFRAKVTEIDSEQVTLDLNHPLAGETLHFAVEIVAID